MHRQTGPYVLGQSIPCSCGRWDRSRPQPPYPWSYCRDSQAEVTVQILMLSLSDSLIPRDSTYVTCTRSPCTRETCTRTQPRRLRLHGLLVCGRTRMRGGTKRHEHSLHPSWHVWHTGCGGGCCDRLARLHWIGGGACWPPGR